MDSSTSELSLNFAPPSAQTVPAGANKFASGEQFLTVFEATAGDCLSNDAADINGERNGKVPVIAVIDCMELAPAFRKDILSEVEINRNADGATAWEGTALGTRTILENTGVTGAVSAINGPTTNGVAKLSEALPVTGSSAIFSRF